MTRSEAIALLSAHERRELSPAQREAMLADYWHFTPDDPELTALPAELRTEMQAADGPGDCSSSRYDPLVELSIRRSYFGVVNGYIEERLSQLGHPASVTGDPEHLAQCPCCSFLTLGERGTYEVCPVCYWEDDGTSDPEKPNGPNHMTLTQGRSNFAQMGAMSEAMLPHVLKDGPARYPRGR